MFHINSVNTKLFSSILGQYLHTLFSSVIPKPPSKDKIQMPALERFRKLSPPCGMLWIQNIKMYVNVKLTFNQKYWNTNKCNFIWQVYKKKTEAAKKEYLKALAAYRASLVSKGAGDNDGMYPGYNSYNPPGPQYGGYSPQGTLPSPPMSSATTPPSQQPKKPPQMGMGMGGAPQSNMMQNSMGHVPNHMNMQHMSQQHSNGYMQQVVFVCIA